MRAHLSQVLGLLGFWIVGAAQAQSDLEQFVAEIREQGMTEAARQNLATVASIWAGATLFAVEKLPSGEYETRYTTGFFPRPGADAQEVTALRQKLEERVQAELRRLKSLADRDASGFVSTAEGAQFREVILFGLRVSKLEPGDRQNAEIVARALPKELRWVKDTAREYGDLRQRLSGESPGLPEGALPTLAF